MTTKNTKRTLADFAAKNCPKERALAIEYEGETFEVTAKRLALADLLSLPGMDEVLSEAQEEETDFGEKPGTKEMLEKLSAIDSFLVAATTETKETIGPLPLPLKNRIFREVFAFQQLAGGEFRGSS